MKGKSPLYYFSLAVVFFAIFQYYNDYKEYQDENKKPEIPAETKVIHIDFSLQSGNFLKSITDVTNSLKEITSEIQTTSKQQTVKPKTLFTYHSKFNEKPGQVGLCANFYNIEIEGYAEDNTTLIAKTNMGSLQFKEYPEFYEALNKALTLTAKGQRIEFFANNLGHLPKIFTDSKNIKFDQSGMIFITNKEILGSTKFNSSIVKSKIVLPIKDRERANFKFFCKEEVEIKYTLTNASGKILQKEKSETITLGGAKNKKEEILEYLILNSYDGNVDAQTSASYFIPKNKLKNIKIKGTIIKKSEA